MTTDEDLYETLGRSLAEQGMTTSLDDVVARGRRTRNKHRAIAAGIGTSTAAIVAAIGVLAPSVGSGTSVSNPAATTSRTFQNLDVDDAAFSLHATTDGAVNLRIKDMSDADKLRAALDKAGIPANVQLVHPPAGWNWAQEFGCELPPGVTFLRDVSNQVIKNPEQLNGLIAVRLYPKSMPTGAVLSIVVFIATENPAKFQVTYLKVLSGDPGPCHLTAG